MHTVGEILRQWRQRRGLSQLDLAIAADVSARHVSLVETGKSKPSPDMILRLADQLHVPLRERNRLLLAGGFAPRYAERSLDHNALSAVHDAVRRVLRAVRLGLDPRGFGRLVVNLADVRAVFRSRISRQLATAPDPELTALYEELLAPEPEDTPGQRIETDVVIPMILRVGGRELRLFSTITTFGTPMDITIDEIAIESYYPADAESAAYFTT
ncbi:helix-turn-helix domain-containing protein [Micromonospora sp. WMMA1947]|uniref:helix-turn-helix domain-containing protein n=1 Tax=Micromonospora sp. WMMA1947 TaxID=3015163 RepID=UPI00248C2774|nr:helix-turn-helix domain-containing protein [Micromonospora sp. WMMA1947]WBC09445.1 helix-turn-helix domain-containing protein [Micromonospora sp. WMMA1947]